MLDNQQIAEYERLLQKQEDGDELTPWETDRLYELEQRAAYNDNEEESP